MSFLHGSDCTLLAHHNASCATPRHARQCLLRQSLHAFEHRLRTQLEFLKQHATNADIHQLLQDTNNVATFSFRITVADPSSGVSSILTSHASGTHTSPREKRNHHLGLFHLHCHGGDVFGWNTVPRRGLVNLSDSLRWNAGCSQLQRSLWRVEDRTRP